jgi:hypothetical protein
MKKLLSLIVAVALCGCASTHVKHSPAPVVAVASVDHTAELAAIRAPQVTPQVDPQVAPAVSPAKVAAKPAPVVVIGKPAESSVEWVVTVDWRRVYIFGLSSAVLAFLVGFGIEYGPTYIKKFLAWFKGKSVLVKLKALATEAESKIKVDFKDVVGKPIATFPAVSSPKTVVSAPVLPLSTTAHLSPVEPVKK